MKSSSSVLIFQTIDVERLEFDSFYRTSPLASSNVINTEIDRIKVPTILDTYTPLCIRVDNSSLDKLSR